MEKQLQMISSTEEYIRMSAHKIDEILTGQERTEQLQELKKVAVEHVKMEKQFLSERNALAYVNEKMKAIPDLEVEKVMTMKTVLSSKATKSTFKVSERSQQKKSCQHDIGLPTAFDGFN